MAIRSMTAYGRSKRAMSTGEWTVEIHSVNRKMLDTSVQLPRDLLFLDLDVRKWVGEAVQRGQVTVRVQVGASDGVAATVERLSRAKKRWDGMAKGLGLDPKKEVTLPFLLGVLEETEGVADEGAVQQDLKKVFAEALKRFIAMRLKEGEAIARDMAGHLAEMKKSLRLIEKGAPGAEKRYRERLEAKIRDVSSGKDEERVAKEVVLYADKVDISEEIVRLFSHIDQFEALLKQENVGKTLEFLTQEMGREINTLGAKTADTEIAKRGLAMKGLLEKIREQVQNVE